MATKSRGKPKVVTGEYDRSGYEVWLWDARGARKVYSAGNNPFDSQAAGVPGLPLREVRRFCLRTCREIAGERKVAVGGVFRREEKQEGRA